jgi:hypothetical protein
MTMAMMICPVTRLYWQLAFAVGLLCQGPCLTPYIFTFHPLAPPEWALLVSASQVRTGPIPYESYSLECGHSRLLPQAGSRRLVLTCDLTRGPGSSKVSKGQRQEGTAWPQLTAACYTVQAGGSSRCSYSCFTNSRSLRHRQHGRGPSPSPVLQTHLDAPPFLHPTL